VSDKTADRAFVGLGSNLEDPANQLQRAIAALADVPHTKILNVSSFYRSAPFGPVEQPDFLNAVVQLETRLDARNLLLHLLAIERQQGRTRGERWGPRTIDLDLLVHGETSSDTAELRLPHPGIALRNFVLLPLQEIAPDLVVQGLGRIADIVVSRTEPRISRVD
jgi:2-amino-4-hydroxy-6-hydroxymethyldihydropteridine diphosphokinase